MKKDKRLGPDTIMNIISGISIASWVILVIIFIMIAVSNPGSPTTSAIRSSSKNAGWITTAIYVLLVFLIIISASGIFFNMTRMKRKTDKMRLTPIFSGILSIIALILMNI